MEKNGREFPKEILPFWNLQVPSFPNLKLWVTPRFLSRAETCDRFFVANFFFLFYFLRFFCFFLPRSETFLHIRIINYLFINGPGVQRLERIGYGRLSIHGSMERTFHKRRLINLISLALKRKVLAESVIFRPEWKVDFKPRPNPFNFASLLGSLKLLD